MPSSKRALLIASPFGGLRGPLNDVGKISKVLKAREFDITYCCDENATRDGIRAAWRNIIDMSSSGDTVVIFYSGHGGLVETRRSFKSCHNENEESSRQYQFIVPMDFDQTTDGDFRGLLDVEMAHMLRNTTNKTTNVTVILDCCHSGRMARAATHGANAAPKQLPTVQHSDIAKWVKILKQEGHIVGETAVEGNMNAVRIAACATRETAWEYAKDGKWGGILTEALVRAIDEKGNQDVSWRTLLIRVNELVHVEFPQQHPRVEGPDTRECFSMISKSSAAILITPEGENTVIHAGRVVGVREGNVYGVMPLCSKEIGEQDQIALATVTRLLGFRAKVDLQLREGRRFPRTGALAFLCEEALYKWPVILPENLPGLQKAVADSHFLKPYNGCEDASYLILFRHETGRITMHTERGLQIASQQIEDAPMASAESFQGILWNAEIFAKAQHLLRLKCESPRKALSHDVGVDFGTVHQGGTIRPVEQDGSGLITVGDKIYISLRNVGRKTVYVSVFDVNAAGEIFLLSTSNPHGIELQAGHSYTLGMDDFEEVLHGLSTEWPTSVPSNGQIPEHIIFVLSTVAVDLRHLTCSATSNGRAGGYHPRMPRNPEKGLKEITYQLASGGRRTVSGERRESATEYDVFEIPFSLVPPSEVESEQRFTPAMELPAPENISEWNTLPAYPPHVAVKGVFGAGIRAFRGIPACVWVVNEHVEEITVVVSKYRPNRLFSGLGFSASSTGAGVDYSTTTFLSPATTKTLAPRHHGSTNCMGTFPLWTRETGFGVISIFTGEGKKLCIENDRISIGATAYFRNEPDLTIVEFGDKHDSTSLSKSCEGTGHTDFCQDPGSDVPPMAVCEGVLGGLPLLGQFPSGLLEERSRSEAATRDPLVRDQPQIYCRSLLRLGIIGMLQGEPGFACRNLIRASDLSKDRHPDVYIQAIAYLMQCRYMQFKWAAASSVSGVELDDIFHMIPEMKELQACLKSAQASENDDVRRLVAVLELQRWIVTARPDFATDPQAILFRDHGAANIEGAIEKCVLGGVEDTKILPFKIELAYLYRIVEGRNNNFGPPYPTDDILRAHYELRMGDAKSVTCGAPETWNMLLEQGTESNAQPQESEHVHFAVPPLEQLQAAEAHYLEAHRLYEAARYGQGQAALQLRFGYLGTLGIYTSSSTTPNAYEVALKHVNRAKLLYSQCGDIAGVQVTTAQSCLCRVGMGQLPEDSDAAKAIGQYGKEKGSRSLAFGLGLFFAKYARRWLVFLGDYEKALAAHKLAAAVFDGLGMKLSFAYSIYDQLSVHELLGDRSMIHITAEHALNVCHEITQERPQTSKISQMALSHAVNIQGKMFQRANKEADPKQLARIAEKLRMFRCPEPTASAEELQSRVLELNRRFQAAMEEGKVSDMGEILTRLQSLDTDPVKLQTQGSYTLVEHFISTAAVMIPLYGGRQADRNGEPEEAGRLWEEANSAIRSHPTSDSEALAACLCVSMRDFSAAALHARRYRDQFGAAEQPASTGTDQRIEGALRRQKWQEMIRVLNLLARVKLYEDAKSTIQKLELGCGPSWWNQYEYPAWENLGTIARVCEGLGEYERAYDYYEKAMETFEKRRHTLSVDDHRVALAGDSVVQEIYFGAAHAAARWHLATREAATGNFSPHIQRAFAAIERGKARSLLDLIEGSVSDSTRSGNKSQWQEYKRQANELHTLRSLLSGFYETRKEVSSTESSKIFDTESRLKNQIREKEKKVRHLEATLSTGRQKPASTIGKILTLPSLCQLLPTDTALLQYCYGGEALVMWKITASGISEVFVLDVPEVQLERSILQYHKACANTSPETLKHEFELATLLLPFRSLHESRLIIVPHRSLHQLPFHTMSYQGQLLLAGRTISYLPSASVLKFLQSKKAPDVDMSILAVGNPSHMKQTDPLTLEKRDLPALPGAELEVKAIKKEIPSTMTLIRQQATKDAVCKHLSGYRVLHFATHGSLSKEVPMLSAIHLAEGESITVEDFMWRHLRAELVVLSACETGRGEPTGGDDVIGFSRALLAAGVKTVIVSLWSVGDDVTSFLMTKFYERLKEKWCPAEALQAAQLATRQASQHEVQKVFSRLHDVRPDTAQECDVGRNTASECDVQRDTAPERHDHRKHYAHPNYWAPFILIGSNCECAPTNRRVAHPNDWQQQFSNWQQELSSMFQSYHSKTENAIRKIK